ncbi:porin [Inquilinus sp. CAU 1745]|uniref:porin n=1 Tax=Inquilinus sp. CAU 1745 TaxID=3140369 RepID=UPI00325A4DD9
MKKVLLGTSAIVGFGLLASPAFAQLELAITGSTQFEFGYVDEDEDGGAERDHDFRQDGVIQFNADGVADNGLEYGAEIEMDDISAGGSGGDGDDIEIDEQYLYIGGGFGQIRLGDKEGPVANFMVAAPTVASGGYDGNYSAYTVGSAGSYLYDADDGLNSDSTKIHYLTPNFGGFQAGISYAPTPTGEGKDGIGDRSNELGDAIEIGGAYNGDFGGFDLTLGAGYVTASGDAGDDYNGYDAGVSVGFGGFTFGVGYVALTDTPATVDNGLDSTDPLFASTGLDEQETWQVGAAYTTGPWTVGASAAFDERDFEDGSDAGTDIYTVGAEYALAPGLTVYSDVSFVDAEATPYEADNEATVFIIGTSVAF